MKTFESGIGAICSVTTYITTGALWESLAIAFFGGIVAWIARRLCQEAEKKVRLLISKKEQDDNQ